MAETLEAVEAELAASPAPPVMKEMPAVMGRLPSAVTWATSLRPARSGE